ncbi:MAG: phenylacetate--CoA ligase, partial [Candidatus Melainabacteria bacterium]
MELLSGSDLRCLQVERLKALVERLQARVPFYKAHLKGIASDKLKTLDDLRWLPFTNKADLRNNYPLGLLAVSAGELVRIQASSGTKGKPNVAGYTKQDLSLWAEVCARSLAA